MTWLLPSGLASLAFPHPSPGGSQHAQVRFSLVIPGDDLANPLPFLPLASPALLSPDGDEVFFTVIYGLTI